MKTNNNALLGILVLVTIVIVTIATFSLGCTETPVNAGNETDTDTVNTTDETQSEDFIYGTASVSDIQVLILESFPVQVHVAVTGNYPDGCTEVHKENIEFDGQTNTFTVELTTRRPADAMCTQALVPFEHSVALDVYGLEKGVYYVDVNGARDQFELQIDNIISE
ncbi:MAG: hypothetical protein R2741_00555 [Methanolobus sp.]